jgi:HD superfamily phosphohydrolase
VHNNKFLQNYYPGFKKLIEDNDDVVEHEIISCAFIFILLDDLKKENIFDPNKFSPSAKKVISTINPERVVKLIEPYFPGLPDFLDSKGNNYTPFFSRIITAFPIDADRMDYLWRDSYFSGVTYGFYDINRIFSSFLATKTDGPVKLTYKESGLDSMLRFIQSRSHLYNQVYFHKTNRSANTMLSFLTATKKNAGIKLLDTLYTIDELMGFYITNGDDIFLSQTVPQSLIGTKLEKDVHADLLKRKLFKRVFQEKIVLTKKQGTKGNQIKQIKNSIDRKLKALRKSNIFAVSDMYKNEVFKDYDKKAILIAQKAEKRYKFMEDWTTVGKEFELADVTVLMIRVYLKRTFTSSNEFEDMKNKIHAVIKNEIDKLRKIAS